MKAQLQKVEIEWVDSSTTRGWQRPDDFTGPIGMSFCLSIGYLSKYTKTEVQVVQSRHDNAKQPDVREFWADAITIPRACVKKIRVLR